MTQRHARSWRRLAVLALLLSAAARTAWAQTVSLMNGSVLTMNGLTLTVSNCRYTSDGVAQSSCSLAHVNIARYEQGRGYVGVRFVGDGKGDNGSNVLETTAGDCAYENLTFTLSAATDQPGSTVSGAWMTIAGNSKVSNAISAAQSFYGPSGKLFGSLTENTSSQPSASVAIPNYSVFSFVESLTLNPDNHTGALRLTSTVNYFSTVPEPASAAVLLAGLGGLAVARHLRRISASRPGKGRT